MYFNVNFNVFFKLIKVHLLVSELYMSILISKLLMMVVAKNTALWNMVPCTLKAGFRHSHQKTFFQLSTLL